MKAREDRNASQSSYLSRWVMSVMTTRQLHGASVWRKRSNARRTSANERKPGKNASIEQQCLCVLWGTMRNA